MFEDFSETSRLWVFSADRFLTQEEQILAKKKLDAFVQKWATHGKGLFGASDILFDNFIVVTVDEERMPASGCSIDTLTQFIKALGTELNLNFFNRLSILIEKDGEFRRVHFSELNQHPSWNMFNPMVSTIKDFRSSWHIPVSEFTN